MLGSDNHVDSVALATLLPGADLVFPVGMAKSGFTEVDVIPLVEAVEEVRADGSFLYLTLLLKAQNPGLNPDVLLQGFREESPALSPIYTAGHREEILDEEKQPYR